APGVGAGARRLRADCAAAAACAPIAPAAFTRSTSKARDSRKGRAAMRLKLGDFDDSRVLDLLRLHLEGMHASSPPGTVYALDLSGLRTSQISFWTAWRDEALLGCGALKEIDPAHGEIKSMRTAP